MTQNNTPLTWEQKISCTNNPAEYESWRGMIARCNNPKNHAYKDYGGRGIGVCDRWLHSFRAFVEDMGPKPSSEYSIDRWPDNNGKYEPTNCRWATRSEQNRNKRSNRIVEINGESKTLVEWSEELGTPIQTLYNRIKNKTNLTRPKNIKNFTLSKKSEFLEVFSKLKNSDAAARQLGINIKYPWNWKKKDSAFKAAYYKIKNSK